MQQVKASHKNGGKNRVEGAFVFFLFPIQNIKVQIFLTHPAIVSATKKI